MKNLGFIMLLLLSLVGCKAKKSHVVKSHMDSSYVNRGINNIEIGAISGRELNSRLRSDSSWNDVVWLRNFTGTISPKGGIKGEADEAMINRTGKEDRLEEATTTERDSTNIKGSSDIQQQGNVSKEGSTRSNQTEGFDIPWYAWLFIVGGILVVVFLLIKF